MPELALGTDEVFVTTPALPSVETVPPTGGVQVSTPTLQIVAPDIPRSVVEVSTPAIPQFITTTPTDGPTVLVGPGVKGDKGDPGESGSGSVAVPTELLAAEVFAIPDRRQALFHIPIVYGAGASITTGVNSALVSV